MHVCVCVCVCVCVRACTVLPVLVAGDPVGDVGHGLTVAVLVPEAAGQHDELPLQLPVETEREKDRTPVSFLRTKRRDTPGAGRALPGFSHWKPAEVQ